MKVQYMNLEQIKSFISVAKTGNYSTAAMQNSQKNYNFSV